MPKAHANNGRTVAAYENYARRYATNVSPQPSDSGASVGEDECWEHTASGDYRVVRWSGAALDDRLRRSGVRAVWDHCEDGEEVPWRAVLARKVS